MVLLLLVLGGALLLIPTIATGSQGSLKEVYKEKGAKYDVDPLLLEAIAHVESSQNPKAYNPGDPSYGLMQILCKPDGSGGCANTFYIDNWPPAQATDLYDPRINVDLGAQIIASNVKKYGLLKGIAVYNSWSARDDLPMGPFVNQDYVAKVAVKYAELGGMQE